MKKAIKPILITLVVLCVVALFVCNFVIPTETKAFIENVIFFINQPLPIVGVSLFVIGGFVLKAISMTSFGKKALADLKAEHNKWKKEVDETESKELELKAEVDETKQEVEETLDLFAKDTDELIKVFYEALKTSPNKKVKAFAKKLVELYPLVFEKEVKELENSFCEKKSHEEDTETSLENMGLGENGYESGCSK